MQDTEFSAHAGEYVNVSRGGSSGGDVVNVYVDVRGNAVYAKDLAEEVRSILLNNKRYRGTLGLS
jgi:dTDP-4-dehydrorhamnose reductase